MLCGASWPPRVRLAGQLGETLAALHQLAPPVIRGWWPAYSQAFVAGPRARCVSEQRAPTLPALGRIRFHGSRWVESPSRPPVLLHTEVMRQHLLTAEGPEGHRGCPG